LAWNRCSSREAGGKSLKHRSEGLDDARLGPAVINQQLVAAETLELPSPEAGKIALKGGSADVIAEWFGFLASSRPAADALEELTLHTSIDALATICSGSSRPGSLAPSAYAMGLAGGLSSLICEIGRVASLWPFGRTSL
jgi:hypothetical protein